MPELDDVLAANLRAIRKALGLRQEDMAEAMNMSQGALSRLETGENFLNMKRLGQRIRAAGGDPMDLLHPDPVGAADAVSAEIRQLLPSVSPAAREHILGMLRQLQGVIVAPMPQPENPPEAPALPKRTRARSQR